jgi:hypothetical protein
MKHTLELEIKSNDVLVKHSDPIMLLGSCFTSNIGRLLTDAFFNVSYNRTGILFDVLSVAKHLRYIVENSKIEPSELRRHDELFFHWDFHSDFSSINETVCLEKLNSAIVKSHDFLKDAEWLAVTFGTAFSYYNIADNVYVANNHKASTADFKKELVAGNQMMDAMVSAISALKQFNPDIQVILTISPVRHVRDGVVENNRSKARLIELVHALTDHFGFVSYFPAYELVVDVLRDYRYYDIDLVHPNYLATNYVFERFCLTYMNAELQKKIANYTKLRNSINHRPLHPETKAHKDFINTLLKKIDEAEAEIFWVDWNKIRNDIINRV